MTYEEKYFIAHALCGEIGDDTTKWYNQSYKEPKFKPYYQHIPGVLSKHKITPDEAKDILFEMEEQFSTEKYNILVPKITQYLNILEKEFKRKKPKKKEGNTFTQRQVAIAYCFLENITEDNYLKIQKEHSQSRSKKILQKRVYRPSDLTKLSGNKTSDTKHLKNLNEAMRLLNSKNEKKAVEDIKQIIIAFTTSYNLKY